MSYTPDQAAKAHNDRIQPQIASVIKAILDDLEATNWGDADYLPVWIKVNAPSSVIDHAVAEVRDMGWDIERRPYNACGVFYNAEFRVQRPPGAIKLRKPEHPSRFSVWMARLAHRLNARRT